MNKLTVTEARRDWSNLVDQVAFMGERVLLERNHRPVAALVSAEDAQLLEELEDRVDIEEALKRLADGKQPVPYEAARRRLGLK